MEGWGDPKGKCIKLLGVDKWLGGKFHLWTHFLSLAPVMGCPVVQLSHRYFTEGMKGNCFVGFHMTIPLVSLDRGSRKLNYMPFSNNKLDRTTVGPGNRRLKMIFPGQQIWVGIMLLLKNVQLLHMWLFSSLIPEGVLEWHKWNCSCLILVLMGL